MPASGVFQVSRQVFYVPGHDWWLAFDNGGRADAPVPRLLLQGMYHQARAVRQPH